MVEIQVPRPVSGDGVPPRTIGRPSYFVESVNNALLLLSAIRDRGVLRLTDAAAEIHVAESTAHRLLAMLAYHGYVVRDARRRYLPGPALWVTPTESDWAQSFRQACLPAMVELSQKTGETVNLVVLAETRLSIVAVVEGTRHVRAGDMQGHLPPAIGTAGGRCLMAELTDDEVRDLYARAPASERPSRRDLEAFLKSLRSTRVSGAAVAFDLIEAGLSGVGVPLRNGKGDALGGLSIALPTARVREGMDHGMMTFLRCAAAQIEDGISGMSLLPHADGEAAAAGLEG